jgi:hypothetical protein
MQTVSFLADTPFASLSPWLAAAVLVALYGVILALLRSKPLPLMLAGHVLACGLGIVGLRLLFVHPLGGAATAGLLALFCAPAAYSVFRLYLSGKPADQEILSLLTHFLTPSSHENL